MDLYENWSKALLANSIYFRSATSLKTWFKLDRGSVFVCQQMHWVYTLSMSAFPLSLQYRSVLIAYYTPALRSIIVFPVCSPAWENNQQLSPVTDFNLCTVVKYQKKYQRFNLDWHVTLVYWVCTGCESTCHAVVGFFAHTLWHKSLVLEMV